ncbi:GMC oxidoreductase [Microbacterium elymi]|uniref:GMC oxidoreductase n=1 Tax=Microbacterium elymi TaxID=2909587 RepID=A0ABY5NI93_9MICO|nr:GMC oxidoreductase [Microbacterium elymi]UUT34868.1 GMC oxidoreductase [Microbacterium elymi]
MRVLLGQPIARGRVGIGPGPAVCYGYLTDGRDIRALRDGVRLAAQVLRSPEMAEVVADATIPAWVDAAADPGAEDAERWLRDRLATALHSCGTARMGAADDPDAVADAHGRVHGTTGLRIADASLVPVVPTRGTALLAVMLGERIAELIAQE